ncbi:MAG TPA: hypothetical protein VH439_17085 [Gemmatimonadales bacterium]|jgi:hypothetical protein
MGVDYDEYLASPEWQAKRRARLEMAFCWDSDAYSGESDPDAADDPHVSDDDADDPYVRDIDLSIPTRQSYRRGGPRCEVHWEQGRKIVERSPNLVGLGDRCRHRATQVHHKTYERLGDERMEDLVACCRSCHRAVEKQLARRKGKNPDAR